MAEQKSAEQAPPEVPRGPGRAEDPQILDRISAVLAESDAPAAEDSATGPGEAGGAPAAPQAPPEAGEEEKAGEAPTDAPAAEEAEGEAETVEIGTLGELAEHLGVEVGDLYDIRVPVTGADGQSAEISLGEWKDGYQASDKLRGEQQQLVDIRSRLDTEAAEAREQISRATMEAAAVVELAERQVLADIEAQDWKALNEDDPARYAALRSDFNDRQQAINQAKAQIHQHFQQAQEAQMATMHQTLMEQATREREALKLALPEWRDENRMQAERSEVREYLAGQGFASQEIDNAIDHRLVVMSRKAMLYDRLQKETGKAKAKLVKIGSGKRVLKPGPRPSRDEAQHDQRNTLAAQHKRAGTIDSAADFLASLEK